MDNLSTPMAQNGAGQDPECQRSPGPGTVAPAPTFRDTGTRS